MKSTIKAYVIQAKRGDFKNDDNEQVKFANLHALSDFTTDNPDSKGKDIVKITCEDSVFYDLPDLPAEVTLMGDLKSFNGKNQFVASAVHGTPSKPASVTK